MLDISSVNIARFLDPLLRHLSRGQKHALAHDAHLVDCVCTRPLSKSMSPTRLPPLRLWLCVRHPVHLHPLPRHHPRREQHTLAVRATCLSLCLRLRLCLCLGLGPRIVFLCHEQRLPSALHPPHLALTLSRILPLALALAVAWPRSLPIRCRVLSPQRRLRLLPHNFPLPITLPQYLRPVSLPLPLPLALALTGRPALHMHRRGTGP